jgi:hypothetical protein
MSFDGPFQYGTGGGLEDTTLPTFPAVVRVFRGRALIGFLVVNTNVLSKLREEVEQVTRILNELQEITSPITVTNNGVTVDTNLRELSFNELLTVVAGSTGAVSVYIPVNSIKTATFSGVVASTRAIGLGTILTNDFADLSVLTANIPNAAITPAKLDRTYITVLPAVLPLIRAEYINPALNDTSSILISTPPLVIPGNGITYDIIARASYLLTTNAALTSIGLYVEKVLGGSGTSPTTTVVPFNLSPQSNSFEASWLGQTAGNYVGQMSITRGGATATIIGVDMRITAYPRGY